MKIETVFDKGSGNLNEDALLINHSLFGVFDGATSLIPYADEQGRTGGYLAAHIAREAFAQGNKPLEELACEANRNLRAAMEQKGIDTSKKESLWSTAAAVIKLGPESFDYAQITDSLILVVYNDNEYKLVVDYHDHDQNLLTKWKPLADQGAQNIREVLKDDLIALRRTANIGYGSLNGDEGMVKFLKTGTESLYDVKHVLLFTDGLILPQENPESKADFDTFVKLFLDGGLAKVKEYARGQEIADPQCRKYARVKQHDDIAAIALSF